MYLRSNATTTKLVKPCSQNLKNQPKQPASLRQLNEQFNQLDQKFNNTLTSNSKFNSTINEINKIIEEKGDEFERTINQLKSDIESLKYSNDLLTKCIVELLTNDESHINKPSRQHPNVIITVDGLQPNENIAGISGNNQITQCENGFSNITTNDDHFSSDESKMDNNNGPQLSDDSSTTDIHDRIDDLENAIQCLQAEISKINNLSASYDEKWITMNKQIHVLSAQSIKHMSKINKFLIDFRQKTNETIDESRYLDADTLKFAEINTHQSNHNNNTNATSDNKSGGQIIDQPSDIPFNSPPIGSEFFCSAKTQCQKLAIPTNIDNYTHTIRMKIDDIYLINLNSFPTKFIQTFNFFYGNSIANGVTISKYTMKKGVIDQLEVFIHLSIPLNYKYMDNFPIPINWSIIPHRLNDNYRFRKY